MKILIVGGGPGGLYLARLVKRSRPTASVLVVEQNSRSATYGFGVTLGGSARERMKRIDPELHDRLADAMVFSNAQMIRLDDDEVLLDYSTSGGAIARLQLLQILQTACEEVGVELHHEVRIADPSELEGYDLVIAADGVNSAVRTMFADAFGTHSYFLGNRFAWYGVGRAMKPNALVFRHARGGVFVGHYYTYTANMSTFVAECDRDTWDRCGLEQLSDEERRAFIEEIFALELDGKVLIDNKSIWRSFNVITNRVWVHRNIALLGDALRSAHFSIGSGTRLAMDDAAAFHEAMKGDDDVAKILSRYVSIRKPIRDQFGAAAERSFNWYECMNAAMRSPVMDFTYNFLTRTGRVDDNRLKDYVPKFHHDYSAWRSERQELSPCRS